LECLQGIEKKKPTTIGTLSRKTLLTQNLFGELRKPKPSMSSIKVDGNLKTDKNAIAKGFN